MGAIRVSFGEGNQKLKWAPKIIKMGTKRIIIKMGTKKNKNGQRLTYIIYVDQTTSRLD